MRPLSVSSRDVTVEPVVYLHFVTQRLSQRHPMDWLRGTLRGTSVEFGFPSWYQVGRSGKEFRVDITW